MSSPFKLIAVLIAAGFCVPAAFATDAVTSASVVPAAQKTQDGAVLEGTKTLAAKGGDRLPDNVDAVTALPSPSCASFRFSIAKRIGSRAASRTLKTKNVRFSFLTILVTNRSPMISASPQ